MPATLSRTSSAAAHDQDFPLHSGSQGGCFAHHHSRAPHVLFQLLMWSRPDRPQHADPPHPLRLLRAHRERPRDGRAAKQCDEVTPPHSITSSASASSLSGTVSPSALAALRLITNS